MPARNPLFRPATPPWRARLAGLVLALVGAAAVSGLDWQPCPGGRSASLAVPAAGKPGFTLLPATATGISFTNFIPERRHLTNQILLNGSGVAAGDVDGDGWCDLYFCRLEGANALYRNLGGWRFEDITATSGVACTDLTSTGAAFADLDGDGDLDLVVNTLGRGTHVFFNDGNGRFSHAPFVLNPGKGGMSLALADIDGDGFLDLYVANYRTLGLMDMPNARATFKRVGGKLEVETVNGRPTTAPDLADRFVVGPRGNVEELGEPDVVYHNQGGTNFVAISWTDGAFLDEDNRPLTHAPFDWGLSAMFHDINGDGLPDLYVCNDFHTPDRFWINQGGGRFRLLPRLAQRKTSLFSMAVDFGDINRDGFDDFIVLDMMSRDHRQRMRYLNDMTPSVPVIGQFDDRPDYGLNTLFLNRGDMTFAEIAQLAGLEAAEWAWSCVFLDVDLDGWEDLLVVNGMERAARDLDVAAELRRLRGLGRMSDREIFEARRMFPRLATAKLAFRNRGDLTFEEVGQAWGFDLQSVSQGMALADLDNDGDLDVVLNNMNSVASLYRNESAAPRVAVRLRGTSPNTHGIGARISLVGGAAPLQAQEVFAGGRYLSGDEARRTFAAGAATNRLRLEVTWRNGRRSKLEPVLANHLYEVDEAAAVSTGPGEPRPATPEAAPRWFEDASQLLGHAHHDEPFDDFARQPLLPNKLSQLGPGIAWFDLDGNGWEDLVIAGGKGGALATYLNDGRGGFRLLEEPAFTQSLTRDQTTVLGWQPAAPPGVILAGVANYEDGLALGAAVRLYDLAGKRAEDAVPAGESSPGPLALGDLDGDGTLELFVGGRVVPGKYPLAAESRLLRVEHGKFVLDPERSKALAGAGMVSGAVFSDLDGDGHPELVLATEWGPIRVFRQDHGRLIEITTNLGLARFTGWWNGVTAGDFDEDGRLDLVASNWGRNTKYQAHRTQPLELVFGDFDEDGTPDLLEAHYEPALQKLVPERQLDTLARVLPFLREQFSSHRAFSTAGIDEVLGDRKRLARSLQANWLESTVFLNRGDHFEPVPLPLEAQMAPAFGVCVADFDGDGHEDIFLAQNFFAVQPETPRHDAGRGLWLRGDGAGHFTAVPGQESGLRVYGEQRGAAACDYDGDGRVDLAVTQNGAATRLFHNAGAKPGLRVRLEGPPGNPNAIGAVIRLRFGERLGPAREIHAGSGYWSQDAAVQVLGTPSPPTQAWVRWPGGTEAGADVPPGATAVSLHPPAPGGAARP
jgi:hypothetical protein